MATLSKNDCTILRGLGILAIFLHNYCHLVKSMVKENEFKFVADYSSQMLGIITHPDQYLPMQLFSFFGHYGVSIFLFLSGYGLIKKYERTASSRVGVYVFVRYNYLKLLRLLAVGYVIYLTINALQPTHVTPKPVAIFAMFGMITNLRCLPNPGIYWYFGLMLEIYIVYRLLFYKWRHWSVVVAAMVLSLLLQCFAFGNTELLGLLRFNFIGGLLPFGLGLLVGRFEPSLPSNKLFHTAVLLLSTVLVLFMSFNLYSWLFIPIFILTGSIALLRLLPSFGMSPLKWLGGISACLFVAHPTARLLLIDQYSTDNIYSGFLQYILIAIGLAWIISILLSHIPLPRLNSDKQA